MIEPNIKEIVENLIDTFLSAGETSINLRNAGLTKEMKPDNTPVSNGDLEVNKIITQKIKELTSEIPIVSEETSENKSEKNLKNFWLVDPIDGTYDYINNLEEYKRMKSSLKFCVIAAGEYDGYVAEPRACEWDIAAGHAILKHSGGSVTDFQNKEILYGKKDFKNPSLILKRSSLL